MNYQEMSNLEINCEVLRVFHPEIKNMCMSESGDCFYHCGPDGNGFYQVDIIDYCNSWADAGPIIKAERITLTPFINSDLWQAFTPRSKFEFRDKNPLRAAMVVFLLMRGAL